MGQYLSSTSESATSSLHKNETKLVTIYDEFKLYIDASDPDICSTSASIDSSMNSLLFRPPVREISLDEEGEIIDMPVWLEFNNVNEYIKDIDAKYQVKISYFVMHPINRNSESKYILWSHGNASDLRSTHYLMDKYFVSMKKKVGIIAYDYEGYGYSSGKHTEHNCCNDLTLMVAHAVRNMKIKRENLVLIGQSLGTGIVVDFCYNHDWKYPIVLISPYKSIMRVVIDTDTDSTSFSSSSIYSADKFKTYAKIDELKCQIKIYHGKEDSLILPKHSIEMYQKCPDKITLKLIDGAGHNDIVNYIDISEVIV